MGASEICASGIDISEGASVLAPKDGALRKGSHAAGLARLRAVSGKPPGGPRALLSRGGGVAPPAPRRSFPREFIPVKARKGDPFEGLNPDMRIAALHGSSP